MLAFSLGRLFGDVIYFTNGNVLVVDKAWEDGDSVKYQTSDGIKTVARGSVTRIQQQTPASVPSSGKKYGIALESGGASSLSFSHPSLNVPLTSSTKEISEEIIRRLKENANSDPGDLGSRAELITALNSLASLQLLKGDALGARNSLQQALGYDKKHSTTTVNLAIVHYQMGEYRTAEDLLLRTLQFDARNQDVHYLLGEAYYAQDKISQAINIWKSGLQLGSNPKISSRLQKAEREAGTHGELGLLQSAHFILRYDRQVSDYHLGQEILDTLERYYRQLSFDLTSDPPATVIVILYPDQTYFDVTRAPRWSGAIFDGKIRVPIKGLSSVTSEITAVLIHELTHSFIASLTRGNCPTWFNEGVAQFQEGKSASDQMRLLSQLQLQKQLVPLTNLRGSFAGFSEELSGLAYLEGLSAVEYLVQRHGRQALRHVLTLMCQGHNFENALRAVTSQTLAQFEESWRSSLSR